MKDQDQNLVPLRNLTLDQVPEEILRPTYDRDALTPGIIHIGLGNFHRAHQAWYLHRLMQQGRAQDWAIIGASVRQEDEAQRDRLIAQDHLTTLISLDPGGTDAEIVGSMIDYLPIETGHGALIRQMVDPSTRIVSLTITEGGYFLDPATKAFDPTHPDIQHDVAHLTAPRTAFGAIVAALQLRKAQGTGPFTCQSCDNLPGNGAILRAVVTGLAHLIDGDLAAWIEDHVSFPNSMVDCIVPATGPDELSLVQRFGISDMAPVTHETFRQWVLEDDFCAGRPPWEDVGATMSDQVHTYEAMKLRLLNGGHQLIAAPAEILGLKTIAEAMAHPLVRGFLRRVALTEIAPHVASVPGTSPEEYVDLIDRRFSNTAIHDTVRRVAFDGSSRQTGALFPVIRDALSAGSALEGLALGQALWARMCTGTRENGSTIAPNDPHWAHLNEAAIAARTTPAAWLDQRNLYGAISEDDGFRAAFGRWLDVVYERGTATALQQYLQVTGN